MAKRAKRAKVVKVKAWAWKEPDQDGLWVDAGEYDIRTSKASVAGARWLARYMIPVIILYRIPRKGGKGGK